MKFQDDISNMNTYIRTSRNQYVPHFFKVGGIINKKRVRRGEVRGGGHGAVGSAEMSQQQNCSI